LTTKTASERVSSRQEHWRTDIQGLRGLAVLLVVLFHADLPVPGGFIGVDVFFVISGYVIAANVTRRIRSKTFTFRDFYWSRFRRLVPALSVFVTVVVLMSFYFQSPLFDQRETGKMAVSSMLGLSNLVAYESPTGYFQQGLTPNPLLNTWSLSVEEQFYIGFSLILLLVFSLAKWTKTYRISRLLIGFFIGITLLSFALNVATTFRTPGTLLFLPDFINPDFSFYSPLTRAWEFGIGVLLALFACNIRRISFARFTRFMGLVLIIGSALLLNKEMSFPGFVVLLPVVGTALVIISGQTKSPENTASLNNKVLVSLGDASYSWYLWHWPFIVFAIAFFGSSLWVTGFASLLSLAAAFISLRFVENPNRKMKITSSAQSLLKIFIWFSPPIILGLGLLFFSNNLWFSEALRSFDRETQSSKNFKEECDTGFEDFGIGSRVCLQKDLTGGIPIYLVGDSVAGRYESPLREIANREERSLNVLLHAGCPYLGIDLFYFDGHSETPDESCQLANKNFSQVLSEVKPGLVILASSSVPFYSMDRAVSVNGNSPTASPRQKSEMLREGLSALIAELQMMGHRVVVTQSPPAFFVRLNYFEPQDHWAATKCAGVALFDVAKNCGMKLAFSSIDEYQGDSRLATKLATEETNTQIIDPRLSLCGSKDCSTNDGNTWIFSDGIHLSNIGASRMLTQLEEVTDAKSS